MALPLSILLLVAGCGPVAVQPQAEIEQAWIRLPASPDRPASGFFRMRSNQSREVISSVSSPDAERVEMHMTETRDGVTRMIRTERAHADRGTDLVFEPGGWHLMIFGLRPGIEPGSSIRLDFRFDLAPPVSVEARVVSLGSGPPGPGD